LSYFRYARYATLHCSEVITVSQVDGDKTSRPTRLAVILAPVLTTLRSVAMVASDDSVAMSDETIGDVASIDLRLRVT